MSTLDRIFRAWPAWTLLIVAAGLPALADEGAILTYRAESEMEVDLGRMVDDFLPPLLEMAELESPGEAAMIRAVLDLTGLPALDRLYVKTTAGDDDFLCTGSLAVDTSGDGGLLGALLSVPPGEFRFGRYLTSDEVVMAMSISSVPERILAINDFAARPELREMAPMVPPDPLGMTAMWGVNVREDILPLLSGELDVILFPFREGHRSPMPNMAVVVGLTDGPAFREKVLSIMTNIMGDERVAPMADAPGEAAGAFTFYPVPQGMAYAIGPDFGIVTTDPEGMKAIVVRSSGDMTAAGSFSMHLNTDLMLDMVTMLIEREGGDDPGAAMVADLLHRAREKPIGAIELTTKTGGGVWEWRATAPRSILSMEYDFLKDLVGALPAMRAVEVRKNALRGVVGTVDGALTRYGDEHGETFPATLDGLIEAGYLEAVPEVVSPTSLGRYVDGGYTYVPVRGDGGDIVGYYFFVYGGGEGTGFDVFTDEALADPASFAAAADGVPDGIVSFAYGGTAIPHVQELFGRE